MQYAGFAWYFNSITAYLNNFRYSFANKIHNLFHINRSMDQNNYNYLYFCIDLNNCKLSYFCRETILLLSSLAQ